MCSITYSFRQSQVKVKQLKRSIPHPIQSSFSSIYTKGYSDVGYLLLHYIQNSNKSTHHFVIKNCSISSSLSTIAPESHITPFEPYSIVESSYLDSDITMNSTSCHLHISYVRPTFYQLQGISYVHQDCMLGLQRNEDMEFFARDKTDVCNKHTNCWCEVLLWGHFYRYSRFLQIDENQIYF